MRRSQGFVSVVIPCYNHGAYINDALKSILQQTYQYYEIIIVDDGSDDLNTRVILDEINHPKVSILRKSNGHVSSARNYGIKHSIGEYILTLDADDQFKSEFLEKAVSILNAQSTVGVVTCSAIIFDDKGKVTYHDKKGGGVQDFLTYNNSLASALFRFECWETVGGYCEEMTEGYEDWDYWLSVTTAGWKIYAIPEYLYWYRDTPNSLNKYATSNRPELIKKLIERHNDVYRENYLEVIYKKELKIQKLEMIKRSLPYRVGSFMLSPMRFFQSLFQPYEPVGAQLSEKKEDIHHEKVSLPI